MGWSAQAIAEKTGSNYRHITKLREGDQQELNRETAEKFKYFYDLYSMQKLVGRYPDMVRKLALEKGWAPPLAWDDIEKDLQRNY